MHHRPDLDAAIPGGRDLPGQREFLIEIVGFENVVARRAASAPSANGPSVTVGWVRCTGKFSIAEGVRRPARNAEAANAWKSAKRRNGGCVRADRGAQTTAPGFRYVTRLTSMVSSMK